MGAEVQEANDHARRIFDGVWWPLASTKPFPVDPIRMARSLGIDVFDADLDPGVSGALIKEVAQDPVILLNRTDSANRRRFTCAHELGHFVRRTSSVDEFEYVDLRDPLAEAGIDPEEIFANRFAAALLMPETEVRKLKRAGKSDLEMAIHFDVSRDAMSFRLRGLGLSKAA